MTAPLDTAQTTTKKRGIVIAVCSILVIVAVYLAAGGWVRVEVWQTLKSGTVEKATPVVYENITFASEKDRDNYIAWNSGRTFFPWAFDLPYPASLLIATTSFGFLGGIIRVLFDASSGQSGHLKISNTLALSSMTGLLVLGAYYTIPVLLTTSDIAIRPPVLLFMCLLGGLFSHHWLSWLRKQFEKLFEINSKE